LSTNSEVQFLGILDTLLKRGNLAYKAYLWSGEKFLYAKILKEINDAIKQLLVQNTYLLPAAQCDNAIALLHHIDVWSAIWDDVAENEKPNSSSIFIFENVVNFPHTQVTSLMTYYETLRV
jgi:hypothetical protein